MDMDINEAVLIRSQSDLDAFGDLSEWTVVNRSRLTRFVYGCPLDATLTYHVGIVREGDPLRREFARDFGKALHAVVEAVTLGNDAMEAIARYDDTMTRALAVLATEVDTDERGQATFGKAVSKVQSWAPWLDRAHPVIRTKLALGAYGSPTHMTKVEEPLGIAFEVEKVLIMTVPDARGEWNDGTWCFEAKSIAPNRSLYEASLAYERSLQVTIQSLATWVEVAEDALAPFMGTMLDFFVKRSVPVHPDDVKCAKLCECGASTMDPEMLAHEEIMAVATKHTQKGTDPDWIRAHVRDEVGKLNRYDMRRRAAMVDTAQWPEAIFKRDPVLISADALQARVSRDLGQALDIYRRHEWGWRNTRLPTLSTWAPHLMAVERNTDQCFVFNPCSNNAICNDERLELLSWREQVPEGFVRRAPDYVDAVGEGQWPQQGYDEFEWDEGGDDE